VRRYFLNICSNAGSIRYEDVRAELGNFLLLRKMEENTEDSKQLFRSMNGTHATKQAMAYKLLDKRGMERKVKRWNEL
jgi:hypothetical protein